MGHNGERLPSLSYQCPTRFKHLTFQQLEASDPMRWGIDAPSIAIRACLSILRPRSFSALSFSGTKQFGVASVGWEGPGIQNAWADRSVGFQRSTYHERRKR